MPYKADMGTIRGDFSIDSPALANMEKRAVMNIVHCSETQKKQNMKSNIGLVT